MLRLIPLPIASSLLLACSTTPVSRTEPSAPSSAAARFANDEPGTPHGGAARLQVHEAGHVSLPNGQLAISDAFVNDDPVLVSGLPRGEHSVELLVAESASDQRVAAARVRVLDEPVAGWRRVGAIAIDSGTGAFFDPRVSAGITPSNVGRFNDTLLSALEVSSRPTYSIAAMSWEGMTFVAFSTGFGDGAYPVYLGSTLAGVPVAVLVDCEILPWPR